MPAGDEQAADRDGQGPPRELPPPPGLEPAAGRGVRGPGGGGGGGGGGSGEVHVGTSTVGTSLGTVAGGSLGGRRSGSVASAASAAARRRRRPGRSGGRPTRARRRCRAGRGRGRGSRSRRRTARRTRTARTAGAGCAGTSQSEGRVSAGRAVAFGDQRPADEVGDDADAEAGEDDGADAHDGRVDAEVLGDAAADAGDHPVVGRPGQPAGAERRRAGSPGARPPGGAASSCPWPASCATAGGGGIGDDPDRDLPDAGGPAAAA